MNDQDRELLERAAKAAGLHFDPTVECDLGLIVVRDGARCQSDQVLWNPLTDDGDALRLAVTLGHRVETPKYKGFGSSCNNVTVFRDGCPLAQTRRAIVMAAAAEAPKT